jgi:hypothetical protein
VSVAPEVVSVVKGAGGLRVGQRAVSIDYPRSYRRIDGNPSAGCNRENGVAGTSRTPGADYPHSPPLDSRCLAFSGRPHGPDELLLDAHAGRAAVLSHAVVGLVARPIAPQGVEDTRQLACHSDRRDEFAPALLDLCRPSADGVQGS